MKIFDYESAKSLNDIAIYLTREEAEELATYLMRLVSKPELGHVHLSQINNARIEKEITVALNNKVKNSSLVPNSQTTFRLSA